MLPDSKEIVGIATTDGREKPFPVKAPFRRWEVCPQCGLGTLDYNGLLDLECPVCGFSEGPGGGCT